MRQSLSAKRARGLDSKWAVNALVIFAAGLTCMSYLDGWTVIISVLVGWLINFLIGRLLVMAQPEQKEFEEKDFSATRVSSGRLPYRPPAPVARKTKKKVRTLDSAEPRISADFPAVQATQDTAAEDRQDFVDEDLQGWQQALTRKHSRRNVGGGIEEPDVVPKAELANMQVDSPHYAMAVVASSEEEISCKTLQEVPSVPEAEAEPAPLSPATKVDDDLLLPLLASDTNTMTLVPPSEDVANTQLKAVTSELAPEPTSHSKSLLPLPRESVPLPPPPGLPVPPAPAALEPNPIADDPPKAEAVPTAAAASPARPTAGRKSRQKAGQKNSSPRCPSPPPGLHLPALPMPCPPLPNFKPILAATTEAQPQGLLDKLLPQWAPMEDESHCGEAEPARVRIVSRPGIPSYGAQEMLGLDLEPAFVQLDSSRGIGLRAQGQHLGPELKFSSASSKEQADYWAVMASSGAGFGGPWDGSPWNWWIGGGYVPELPASEYVSAPWSWGYSMVGGPCANLEPGVETDSLHTAIAGQGVPFWEPSAMAGPSQLRRRSS